MGRVSVGEGLKVSESQPQELYQQPVTAHFEIAHAGMKVRIGDLVLLIVEKEHTRVNMHVEGDPRRKLSLYRQEFDLRKFEVVPAPSVKTKR